MNGFLALPVAVRLVLVAATGAMAGGLVNWATYRFAWRYCPISPWLPAPKEVPQRGWLDLIPVFGWFRMRREAEVLGAGFWIRPLLVEILLAGGFVTLYIWEVEQVGLIEPLLANLLGRPLPPLQLPLDWLHFNVACHLVLLTFMAAATLIDLDDWIIPDAITVPGTIIALFMSAAVSLPLLPDIVALAEPVAVSQTLLGPLPAANGDQLFVSLVPLLEGSFQVSGQGRGEAPLAELAVGLACYGLWCFALLPRYWRGRRGPRFALELIALRVIRELKKPVKSLAMIVGGALIVALWSVDGASWERLVASLIGLATGGMIVWMVRLIGFAALRKEAMGFGDVTLMMMIGAFLGWQAVLFVFFLAPVAGAVIGILRLLILRDPAMPYGPYLCAAAVVVLFQWPAMWLWAGPIFEVPGLVPAALVLCAPAMYVLLWIMRRLFYRQEPRRSPV